MAFGLILVLSCVILIHKEQETLSRLLNPGAGPSVTEVYSRWLDLSTQAPCTTERVVGWLRLLGYQVVRDRLVSPGQYIAGPSMVSVFTRPFQYPDGAYPAQLLELEFSGNGLLAIRALAGHASLAAWRIEPVRIVEWDSGSKATTTPVRIAELPPYIPRAILAMEDKRFFKHGAIDAFGIARALWVDLRHGQIRQGASTINQQLARSIFLDVRRSWRRKVLEAALAWYLEIRFSKPQLLEMYLNQVYWGQDGNQTLVGIEAASESFFGKPARELTVAESAVLAGMLQSPRRYSPRNASVMVPERKKIVLGLMRDQKVISDEQYKAALAERIRLSPVRKSNEASYFLAMIRDSLGERYDLPALLSGGWKVFTTLDPLLQHEAVQALKPPVGQAAIVAIDPITGAILAWVGGTNFQTNPFDHASDAKRQPGSAFKPFVALAALESRKITTATMLDDKPLRLNGAQGFWSPQNYDRKYRGKASVWDSMVYSLNVPTVRLAMQVGLAPIVDAARRAGITSPLREDLSLPLGTSEVSLLELTAAYAVLACGGERVLPYSIQAVVSEEGKVLESPSLAHERVFAPELAYLVTQMLQEVLLTGTGKASRDLGLTVPAAGKTGTSENYQDAWFVGYTTTLVAGVWVGYDKPQSLGRSAAGIALPLWANFMKRAALFYPPQEFVEPSGLVWKTIDPDSGLLAKTGCPHRRKAAFLPGTEPTQDCTLHSGGLIGLFQRMRSKI